MDVKEKEQYAKELIKICGYSSKNTESRLYALLYHQYAAIALYETASAADRSAVDAVAKRLKSLISIKFKLKERGGRKKEKQENAPTPPKEKIEKKEVPDKKNTHTAKRDFSASLDERRDAFRIDCFSFIGQYDNESVNDFFNYWSEENEETRKMRFEEERYWSLVRRIKRWMKNQYTSADNAATIRLKKTKASQSKEEKATEQLQAVAAIREQDNERREREQEQSKQNQELTDDYLKRNPNGLLARWAREKKRPTPSPSRGGGEVKFKG